MGDLRVSFPKPCDESWDAMAPRGCAKLCGRCDTLVHDLTNFDLEEAEALLRRNPEACVRAKVAADGSFALKPGGSGTGRRMVLAAAVTAGLLAAGEPALAETDRPHGSIAGEVETFGFPVRVVATDGAGRTFRAKANRKGRFRIKHLPAGVYTLTFTPNCGTVWTVADVTVGETQTSVPPSRSADMCIVVGRLLIEDNSG
ncbi:MAG TPA: carboxypeptidase-like regulatory domain-containing protein [Allosphingosinicella sp.]|jgi:hypothetical protein